MARTRGSASTSPSISRLPELTEEPGAEEVDDVGGDDEEPGGEVVVGEVALHCVVCRHERFTHRRAQLHSKGLTLFGLEWLGSQVECYVCTRCGYIHWFKPA